MALSLGRVLLLGVVTIDFELLPPRVVAPRLTRVPASLLRLEPELRWVTWGVEVLRLLEMLLERSTRGVEVLRLLEMLLERST
jgi:hypothetical protein